MTERAVSGDTRPGELTNKQAETSYSPLFWTQPSLTTVTSLMLPQSHSTCRRSYTPAPEGVRRGGGREEGRGVSSPSLSVSLPPSLVCSVSLFPSFSLAASFSLASLSKAVCSGFPLLPLLFSLALSPGCCLPLSLDLPTPRQ